MRRIRHALAVLSINLVAILVGVEALGVLAYALRTGGLFYAHSGSAGKAVAPDTPAQIAEAVFHPFFGYLHRVGRHGGDWTTNNHGFQFVTSYYKGSDPCCDYPYKPKADELVVGVFGGSVATGFALDSQRSGAFAATLAKYPAFAGKKVRILNFSMPGWMQPHQLIVLSYYIALGQKFDVVLELDGFNEAVSIERNWRLGVEPTFPADVIWGEWGRALEQRTGGASDFAGVAAEYHKRSALEWRRYGETCKTATCWLVSEAFNRFHRLRESRAGAGLRERSNASTLFPTARMSKFPDGVDIYSFTADRWFDASVAMAELIKAQGGIYLHVLQPNQWFKPSGDYTPIDPAHQYGFVITPVNRTYTEMQKRIPDLRAKGVRFLDATTVFAGQPARDIYIDDCCHYTLRGNDLLAESIAESLGDAASQQR